MASWEGPNSYKNGVFELTLTCRPRCSGLPPKGLESLTTLAPAALLRPVSPHVLALSLAFSIGGVLDDGTLWRPFNPADVLPSCSAGWGRGVLLWFYLYSMLDSLGCSSGGALLSFLRPVVPYTLELLCSALRRSCLRQWSSSTALLLTDRLSPQLFL